MSVGEEFPDCQPWGRGRSGRTEAQLGLTGTLRFQSSKTLPHRKAKRELMELLKVMMSEMKLTAIGNKMLEVNKRDGEQK